MKLYILTWNRISGKTQVFRQQILDALDDIKDVHDWRAATGAIFVTTDRDEEFLTDELRKRVPNLVFIFSLIEAETTQGYADKNTWEFIDAAAKRGER